MRPIATAAYVLRDAQVVPGCCPNCADRMCERIECLGEYTDVFLLAEEVLTALHEAGWRIVRTATCSCGHPDDEHTDGYHHPDDSSDVAEIVDEWEPERSPEEPCG